MIGILKENLKNINGLISGEKNSNSELLEPTIIAISKKQPIEKIRSLYSLGIRNFGENYWQEAQQKIEKLNDLEINWHFVGALQSKKIREIVGKIELIHSVHREKELILINEEAKEKKIIQKILVQLNIGREESKAGVTPEEVISFCTKAHEEFANIQLAGMMVFPPLEKNVEKSLFWFQQSAALFNELKTSLNSSYWNVLSMGTSADFQLAYRCGATHLRIGESLLGKR